MWFQLGPQRLVESVGEVRGRDAQGELHQRLGREMAAQRLDEGAVDLDSHRHLLRVAERQALELREQGARLEVGQDLELLPRDSEPLSEGRVVRRTVAAPIELRCPNVGDCRSFGSRAPSRSAAYHWANGGTDRAWWAMSR